MYQYQPTRFNMLPDVVKNLLIINGLVFLATQVLSNSMGFEIHHYFGLHYFGSDYFRPHQLVTHLFMHGGFMHLFSNMFALWMFGTMLENTWGPKRFLIYYILTGLGAALLHSGVTFIEIQMMKNEIGQILAMDDPYGRLQELAQDNPLIYNHCLREVGQNIDGILNCMLVNKMDIPTVGASGAVFGVLLAFGMLFPNTMIYLMFLFPMRAKYFVLLYGFFELYAGFSNQPGDNVAHFAHLGGMLFGYLLIRIWNKNRHRFY